MSLRTMRHTAQQAAILGMEATTLAAVAFLFGAGGRTGIPWLAFTVIGILMVLVNRWLFGLEWWESGRGKAISVLSGIVGTSVLMGWVSPEIGFIAGPLSWLRAFNELPLFLSGNAALPAALIGGGGLYYRTLLTVRAPIGVTGIARRFLVGLIVFAWVIVFMEQRTGTIPWSTLLAFSVFALLGFTLSRTHELNLIPGVSPLPVTPRWAWTMLGIIGAVLVIGVVLQALSVDILLQAGVLLRPLWRVLSFVFALIGAGMAILLSPLAAFLSQYIEADFPTTSPVPTEGEPPPSLSEQFTPGNEIAWLYLFIGIAGAVFIIWIFNQTYRRFNQRRIGMFAPAAYEQSNGKVAWFPFQFANPFARRRADFGIETVRDLYKNLLVFGENHGIVRANDDTPYEYLAPLEDKYPLARDDFRLLTEAYVATHYGEQQFTRGEIERLQAAWRRISTLSARIDRLEA